MKVSVELFGLPILCSCFVFMKDEEKEAKCELEEVSVPEILEAQREEQLAKEEQERAKTKAKLKKGLPVNASDTYLSHDDVFN